MPFRRAPVRKCTQDAPDRSVTLDSKTVEILREHRHRCDGRAAALEITVRPDGFVFSLTIDCSKQIRPDTITQHAVASSSVWASRPT
jgi:integrase